MKDIKTFIAEKFIDKDFEKKYHRTAAFYRLADEFLLLRRKRGLTQKELAEKVGTTQAVISRLESASVKPSLETIVKLAEALDAAVNVRLIPLEETRKNTANESEIVRQNKNYPLDGIVYFNFELLNKETENWVDPKKLDLSIFNLSLKPTLKPISKKQKIYA
jgi:transcriptional regulator with XRE-family HTH domain